MCGGISRIPDILVLVKPTPFVKCCYSQLIRKTSVWPPCAFENSFKMISKSFGFEVYISTLIVCYEHCLLVKGILSRCEQLSLEVMFSSDPITGL